MKHYYELNREETLKIRPHLEEKKVYVEMIKKWLEKHFDMEGVKTLIYFDDIPELNDDILNHNPNARRLLNKSNQYLSRKNEEAAALIKDWKQFKAERGYQPKESPNPFFWSMYLHDIFQSGSVETLNDLRFDTIYLKSEIESTSDKLNSITIEDYNLREIVIVKNS